MEEWVEGEYGYAYKPGGVFEHLNYVGDHDTQKLR
jgi:hypothetical protein